MSRVWRPDPWVELRTYTAARIALGRSGASLPTVEVLRLGVAQAQARDAVHFAFDIDALRVRLAAHGFETHTVESAAGDRTTYLRRPDLGRQLSECSRATLAAMPHARHKHDVLVVAGDGLSPLAVHRHAVRLLVELRAQLAGPSGARAATGRGKAAAPLQLGPVLLARQARVALGDEIGEVLQARAVVMLVGERPGLSSPDSLGAYLTWAPRRGRTDAERNCVSNIRPEGMPPAEAARRIAWLLGAARRLGATGIRLKDESGAPHARAIAAGQDPSSS